MKLMEIYGREYGRSGWDTSTTGWQNREQSRMDSARAAFKRDEMETELGHEDREPAQHSAPRPAGLFVIRIGGRVWKKQGASVVFATERQARSAAEAIRQRMAQRGQAGDVQVAPL